MSVIFVYPRPRPRLLDLPNRLPHSISQVDRNQRDIPLLDPRPHDSHHSNHSQSQSRISSYEQHAQHASQTQKNTALCRHHIQNRRSSSIFSPVSIQVWIMRVELPMLATDEDIALTVHDMHGTWKRRLSGHWFRFGARLRQIR
jgi:hypothetical protein